MNTLRNRLLVSYIAVLLITLILIGVTLLVFLRTQPLPTEEIISRLTVTLLDVRTREMLSIELSPGSNPLAQTILYLESDEELSDVRLLVMTQDHMEVVYDSAEILPENVPLHVTNHEPLGIQNMGPLRAQLYEGHFRDPDGTEWIYVAQPLRLRMMGAGRNSPLVLVAEPLPRASLREVFRVFGDTFFTPLARAGGLGLLVALLLSMLISRSVARPLQQMSRAARRIAGGEFGHRVKVDGPREVQALAMSFNEMSERVQISQQAQRDFLANVTHDLRTPLTSIQGFSQAILDDVASDPQAAQHVAQIIYDEAARMHRMVESLLDLARIEAGRMDMRRQVVQVADLLKTIGTSLSVEAQEKGVLLALDISPELPRIAGDADRLAQVFTNLIDNAIQHTPPGGSVNICTTIPPDGVVVTVRDTGEGIPTADLPRIFERFYQVDKSRQRDHRTGRGLGLGLAITRQIVEAHGGTIHVASKIGDGTIFTVWLPLPGPEMSTISTRK